MLILIGISVYSLLFPQLSNAAATAPRAETPEDIGPDGSEQAAGEKEELKMEADFVGFKGEEMMLRHSAKTVKNFAQILDTRVIKLCYKYCGSLAMDMQHFAEDHAEGLGVTNKTVPNFDAYDVAQRLLLVYENLKPDHHAFKAVNHTLTTCTEATSSYTQKIPKREHALWILGCMANGKKREAYVMSAAEAMLGWTVSIEADAALEGLGEVLYCRQQMIQLAMFQLDVEYKIDGVKKAHAAGKMSKDKMDMILQKSRIPTRGDHQRYMISKRFEEVLDASANVSAAAAATNATE